MLWLFFPRLFANLSGVLEKEAGEVLTRLKQNQIIANSEKLHAIFIRKYQTNTSRQNLDIKGKPRNSEEIVKILGIYLE